MENVLIVGSGAIVSALAKKLKKSENVNKIYAISGNDYHSEYWENVDIREDDLTGILKFVIENDIKLTIPTSIKALKADIVSFFTENGQSIFGPDKNACFDFLNKSSEKKFLYRNRVQCPRFGVFSKPQEIKEYLNQVNFPVLITSNEPSEFGNERLVCPTISVAQHFLNDLFNRGNLEILIEEFTFGKNFTMYYITDGYTALPITSVYNEKFDKKGFLTDGVSCCVPNLYVTDTIKQRLQNIADNIIRQKAQKSHPYLGIFGIEGTLTGDDKFVVEGISTFFKNHDISAVLNVCEQDLYEIFKSCVNGFFSDEYEYIETNALNSVSVVVNSVVNVDTFENIDCLDFLNSKMSAVLTRSANTLSRAKMYLKEDLDEIAR